VAHLLLFKNGQQRFFAWRRELGMFKGKPDIAAEVNLFGLPFFQR
jgi:hypothetical protein